VSLVRLCDRCNALATVLDLATTTRTCIVPATSPSTLPVAKDMELSFGIQAAQDLCGACAASALLEFAIARLSGILASAAAGALVARLQAAIKQATATAAAAAPAEPAAAAAPVEPAA
jgi:hypothetical protein